MRVNCFLYVLLLRVTATRPDGARLSALWEKRKKKEKERKTERRKTERNRTRRRRKTTTKQQNNRNWSCNLHKRKEKLRSLCLQQQQQQRRIPSHRGRPLLCVNLALRRRRASTRRCVFFMYLRPNQRFVKSQFTL